MQVKQKVGGIFISQDKYLTEILKKFGFTEVKTASTPMETQKPLLKDKDGKEVDVHLYRSVLKRSIKIRPLVSYDSPFDLVAYTDSDYTGASLDRMSTIGDAEGIDCLPNDDIFEQLTLMGYEKLSQKLTFYKAFFSPQWKFLIHIVFQCLSAKTTAWNEFSSTMASAIICLAINQKFNFSKYIFESMVKNLDNAGKFLMYSRFVQVFLNNQLKGMETHNRTYIAPSHTNKIFANMRRQGKDFSGIVTPLFPTMVVQEQEEIGEGLAMPTDPHHTPIITQPSSSQPQRKQKSRRSKRKDTEVPQPSDPTNVADKAVNEEPSMQLKELMDFCTKLQQRVLDLENTKTAQAQEITSLKLRVKKLENKGGSRTHKLRRLYKVGRSARVVSSDEASLGDQEDASKQGRKIDDIDADAGITLDSTHFDADTYMFGVHDLDGDEVVVESEVATKKKDGEVKGVEEVVSVAEETVNAAIITEDEITLAQALAELKSVKPKVTTATTATTKGILLQEPSESIKTTTTTTTIPSKDKGKERRKKHFDVKKAEEKRNKPSTRAQQRSIMCTYLKNMAGWKPKDLKNKSFANIQELFDKAFKRVNTFVDFRTELVEVAKMKELMKIIPDEEEVAFDAIPLATKPPSIVDWKIIKEGKIIYYQIIRADGSSKRYSAFIQMLRSFDREDLETLWKLGRIVGIKRLLDDLRVTAAKLMLLVYKLLLLVFRVNAAGTKLQLLKDYNC
ncbi:hypothetical protein Tco_1282688 [Tanacetum coccineum]